MEHSTPDAGPPQRFRITFLPAGEYTVTAEIQGFQAQKQTIGR